MRTASANDGAPIGAIMNSWKSTSLSACTPPFSTFMNGTGTTWADAPPRYRNSDRPSESAAARASAIETPSTAFAPRFALLSVPSRSSMTRSIARWSEPSSRPTSHSRVGFPRESRTSRARTSSIAAMGKVSRWSWGRGGRKRAAASISSAPHSFEDFHREMREAWRSGGLGVVVRVLGGLVTCPEPPGGAAKGRLRLDTALAGERDHREQQVPHPALEPLRALGLYDLLERLADLGGRTVPVRPGEAGVGHALLELGGELQRRQGRGDAGQRIGAALLLPLDRLPIAQHLAGGADLDVAEHVRVPADQLLGDGARDPVDVELPGVLGDLGVEHHLQEQVAQLLAQVVGTGRARALLLDRVEDLVDLLHQVAGEARVGLLGVPGAAAGAAQAGLGRDQVEQGGALRLTQRVDRLDLDVLAGRPVRDHLHQRAVVDRRQQQGRRAALLRQAEQRVRLPAGRRHLVGVDALAEQQQVTPYRAGVLCDREDLEGDLPDVQRRQRGMVDGEHVDRPGGIQRTPGLWWEEQREPRARSDQHDPRHGTPLRTGRQRPRRRLGGRAGRGRRSLDDLSGGGVPAAEARVDRHVGLLQVVAEPLLGGCVPALLARGVEGVAQVVVELRYPHPNHLDDVVAELRVV